MKVDSFLHDINGASRVTKARLKAFSKASPAMNAIDPIGDVAKEWHPGPLPLVVTEIRPAGKTAKTFRLSRKDNKKLPPFYAGQYLVLNLKIGESLVSRPYSISSAPSSARQEDQPFIEITVRRSKGDGFVCDYLNEEIKVGDQLTGTMGCGQFYYEPLRDAKHVVALAGGVGVTPFVSMAREISAGLLDFDLTILYGSVSSDDMILKEELKALEGEQVHVIPVISGEEDGWEGETGFLTAGLIKKYSALDTTYFVCGPQAMYPFVKEELGKLEIPKRRVRFEVFGQAKDIVTFPGYPVTLRHNTYELTVVRGIHEDKIPAKATESLVVALERAGIRIETGCRSGECGLCRTKVLSGNYYVRPEGDGRRAADKDFHYVHACATYPTGNMKIKIPIL